MMPLNIAVATKNTSPNAAAKDNAAASTHPSPLVPPSGVRTGCWDYSVPLKGCGDDDDDAKRPPSRRALRKSASSSERLLAASLEKMKENGGSAEEEEQEDCCGGGCDNDGDRRAAFANGTKKSVSDRSLGSHRQLSVPSFSKIDLDDCPLNGDDSITVVTSGTAVSALTLGSSFGAGAAASAEKHEESDADSSDLGDYVRRLRLDMIRAKEEATAAEEAERLTEKAVTAAGAALLAADGEAGNDEVKKYKEMAEGLRAELAATTQKLEESMEELNRRKELNCDGDVTKTNDFSSASAVPALEEVTVPAAKASLPKSGPWRKLARRIRATQSSAGGQGFSSSSRSVCSIGSILSLDGTAATAPAHLEVDDTKKTDGKTIAADKFQDPRVSTIASLRELLTQIEFQNGLRERSIESLRFTRDRLERELDESRNEQLQLTMNVFDEQERTDELRRVIDTDLASEVSTLRKKVEKRHKEVNTLQDMAARLEEVEERRRRRRKARRDLEKEENSDGNNKRPNQQRRQSHRRNDQRRHKSIDFSLFFQKEDVSGDKESSSSKNNKTSSSKRGKGGGRRATVERSSYADVEDDLVFLAQHRSGEGREYRRQAEHKERRRRTEGRASFQDHLHQTEHVREEDRLSSIRGQQGQSHRGRAQLKRSSFADLTGARQGPNHHRARGQVKRSSFADLTGAQAKRPSFADIVFGGRTTAASSVVSDSDDDGDGDGQNVARKKEHPQGSESRRKSGGLGMLLLGLGGMGGGNDRSAE